MVAAAVAAVMVCGAAAAEAQGPYKVEQTWKIGGDGGWDYLKVDPATHLLYITRGSRVQIVDPSSGKLAGEITGLKGTHGVVFDGEGKYGYISDGGANQVVVFDRQSHAIVTRIDTTGPNPDAIAYEPTTKRVFTFNGRGKNSTVIDTATGKVVATIALPGKPEFALPDGKGAIFVNIEDTSQMVKIDAAAAKVTATWPLAPCKEPSGMAIDTATERLFSVCDNKTMVVVNGETGTVVATPSIGEGPDAAGYDAANHVAFSSNGEGSLTVVSQKSADSYAVLQTLPTRRGARTMTLDDSGNVYVVTADFGPRPAATADNPHPRPSIVPNSFVVLKIGR
jgi:DNA-binding beta-propeller fold protein YncE